MKIKDVKFWFKGWDGGIGLSFKVQGGIKVFGIGKSGSFTVEIAFNPKGIMDTIWNAVKSAFNSLKGIFSGEEESEDYEEFLQDPSIGVTASVIEK